MADQRPTVSHGAGLFEVRQNVTEVWEIDNAVGSMPHPMHIHGFLFQILEHEDAGMMANYRVV